MEMQIKIVFENNLQLLTAISQIMDKVIEKDAYDFDGLEWNGKTYFGNEYQVKIIESERKPVECSEGLCPNEMD